MAVTIVAQVNLDFLLAALNGQSMTNLTPTTGLVHKDAVFQSARIETVAGVHNLYITYTSQTGATPTGFIQPVSTNGGWHQKPG